MNSSPNQLYAAIDLGSNSFHMLVVRVVAGSVQVLAKIKRKVRLASGLDTQNQLSEEAMIRGWDCLRLFAERLQDIPANNIRIVGTATLRVAANVEQFIATAEQILDHPIQIITGEQEAETIYQGVAHTSSGSGNQLVIDIGGASTELIVGQQYEPHILHSLNMGCVLFRERYFAGGQLQQSNFDAAISAAEALVAPLVVDYCAYGWQRCVGASGTVQALQEVLLAQGYDERITLPKLQQMMAQAVACGQLQALNIVGLSEERKPVFVSGLAILIALFRKFGIEQMTTSGGALREGIVYEMLGEQRQENVRQRTLAGLKQQFRIDQPHATRVSELALALCQQVAAPWQLEDIELNELLASAAQLNEIGLLIGYQNAQQHAKYIIENATLPGFSNSQKLLLASLLGQYQGPLDSACYEQLTGIEPTTAMRLTRLLRLAIIFCGRRQDSSVPELILTAEGETLSLQLSQPWLNSHPLVSSELQQEACYTLKIGGELKLTAATGS
ncbi:guanosine-5'-triphosphate,3'-diphosphate diphosphatase [Corallincola holothuriorum]|uniref:Guanosine-5'-triphosphate,3'-diphosphate pyrophosphatase n=1 Tax=Corallincola holothuriorum TaxID=2282215 RepID=A0A368N7I7_9GAMM|nr:guanosine-5'-triphosphate,3'-diphosphate diphosphatase [Corallincola holothuriorum]RCU45494.1 guanosine-5'-triphosphate,3'-diphosphate diphosphatase [Corallincola holothuriorum]